MTVAKRRPARHELYFGSVRVGQVVETGADFPSMSGLFTPVALQGAPVAELLERYLTYSVELGRLFDATDGGPEWESFMLAHEPQFDSLIQTDEWALVGEDGTRTPILIPLFYAEGQIVWRYNLRTPG